MAERDELRAEVATQARLVGKAAKDGYDRGWADRAALAGDAVPSGTEGVVERAAAAMEDLLVQLNIGTDPDDEAGPTIEYARVLARAALRGAAAPVPAKEPRGGSGAEWWCREVGPGIHPRFCSLKKGHVGECRFEGDRV